MLAWFLDGSGVVVGSVRACVSCMAEVHSGGRRRSMARWMCAWQWRARELAGLRIEQCKKVKMFFKTATTHGV